MDITSGFMADPRLRAGGTTTATGLRCALTPQLLERFALPSSARSQRDAIPYHGRCRQQANFLRHQSLQEGRLPVTGTVSAECFAQALEAIETRGKDRIFMPLVTLWVFLG
jgi:hypothetical protein